MSVYYKLFVVYGRVANPCKYVLSMVKTVFCRRLLASAGDDFEHRPAHF